MTNTGDVPFDQEIVVNDVIEAPGATLTAEPNAPWTCTKAAPFTCKHPGPLAAKGSLTLALTFAPNTPPETKEVKNCAAVLATTAPGNPAPSAPKQSGPMRLGGPDECKAWTLPPKFGIEQANGLPVTFDVSVDANGEVSGIAYYHADPDFRLVEGR